jgi:RNA polymerase sigma-70 factor (ECF subfamily)
MEPSLTLESPRQMAAEPSEPTAVRQRTDRFEAARGSSGAAAEAAGEGPLAAAVRRLAERGGAALGALYDLVAADLYGLALWRTGSRDDAADVVQEVFCKLAARPALLAGARAPRAYLLAMTRRAAVDLLRRRRDHRALDDLVTEPPAATGDPAGAVDASRLSALLRALPAVQREALYLRHWAGLTFAEIGRATGVPTFTAVSRCRLGLARLRWRLRRER